MRWYSFDGAIEATWGGGGYGPDGGWGARFGSTYSGQGTAWGAALNAYLDHQQCTPGWEIWHGVRRCRIGLAGVGLVARSGFGSIVRGAPTDTGRDCGNSGTGHDRVHAGRSRLGLPNSGG